MAEAVDYKIIGERPVRPDGVDKVTGRAQYGADLSLPNTLIGSVLRSPHAHARIKSIDVTAALSMQGVYAAITSEDFASPDGEVGGEAAGRASDLAKNVMATDKVLYHGHAVAAIAASTKEIADLALDAIVVVYDVLEPVLDIDEAMNRRYMIVKVVCK